MNCQIDTCEKLFVKLSLYWRSALIGFLALLGLGGGAFTWTWAQFQTDQAEQNTVISDLQSGLNDINTLKGQSSEILANQQVIISQLNRKVR